MPPPWRVVSAAVAASVAASVLVAYSIRVYNKRKNHDLEEKDENESSKATTCSGANNDTHLDHHDDMPSHLKRELYKERRRQEKIPDLARKSPMYDNVQMMDPQGTLLANISKKKARWYVRKNLASWTIPDSCIQLSFPPKSHSSGMYERSIKENVCVVCGDDQLQMRHYVVPFAYRTLLPKQYKSHLSHDVVIVCPDCHLQCEYETQLRMNFLQNGIPEKCRNATHVNQDLCRVRSAALALLRWKHKLPPNKIDEYHALVRGYLKNTSLSITNTDKLVLSSEILQEVANVEYRMANPNFISGPQFVITSLLQQEDKITQFIQDWRRHFVDTMQPRYLPKGWSIGAPVSTSS